MAYPLGSYVQLKATFVNNLGVSVDPTTVTLYVLAPKSGPNAQAIVDSSRVSAGVYYYDLLLDKPGTWYYGWVGTGVVEAASYDIPLQVSPSILHS